jgi:predicted DNA-binding transcriptional regulator AlpA
MRTLSTRPHYVVQSCDAAYLTASQICERFGVSLMWIIRRQKDAGFPKPIRFTISKTARRFWRIADVEKWECERANRAPRLQADATP